MRKAGHVTCMGEMGNAYRVLIRKPDVRRETGRFRHRWDDNNERDIKGIGSENVVQDCKQWWAHEPSSFHKRHGTRLTRRLLASQDFDP
jgi:hypothetical protein